MIVQISRAKSLQHLNAGGTHITDVSVKAMATHCPQLRVSSPSYLPS